jgi:hypothetical protein
VALQGIKIVQYDAGRGRVEGGIDGLGGMAASAVGGNDLQGACIADGERRDSALGLAHIYQA